MFAVKSHEIVKTKVVPLEESQSYLVLYAGLLAILFSSCIQVFVDIDASLSQAETVAARGDTHTRLGPSPNHTRTR